MVALKSMLFLIIPEGSHILLKHLKERDEMSSLPVNHHHMVYLLIGMRQRTLKLFVSVLVSFCGVVLVKRDAKRTARLVNVVENVDPDVRAVIVKMVPHLPIVTMRTRLLRRKRTMKTMQGDRGY